MANTSFAIEVQSVVLYKFGALRTGLVVTPNKSTSLDLTPQIRDISIYESIFSPYLRAEISVDDQISLFVNWPLTGEEAVVLTYKEVNTQSYHTRYFLLDNVKDISYVDNARGMTYVLQLVSIEAYANAKMTVQQAYHDTPPNIAKKIFDEHIVTRTKTIFPAYVPLPLIVDNNDGYAATFVIPNIRPFDAMQMMAGMYVSQTLGHDTAIFFQNGNSYRFTTVQSLTSRSTRQFAFGFAFRNSYKYISNEVDHEASLMQNEGRVVTNLKINKRFGTLEKIALGYFENNLMEINLAQKAVWNTRKKIYDTGTTNSSNTSSANTSETSPSGNTAMYPNKFNTVAYMTAVPSDASDDERANRVRYVASTEKENSEQFPVSRLRDKWGAEIQTMSSLGQVDITATIPGTSIFKAGDLFHMEIPEAHGFNEIKYDDLISGYFLITEVKHVIGVGDYHSTVLRLNKDSYFSSVDRPSRYA